MKAPDKLLEIELESKSFVLSFVSSPKNEISSNFHVTGLISETLFSFGFDLEFI